MSPNHCNFIDFKSAFDAVLRKADGCTPEWFSAEVGVRPIVPSPVQCILGVCYEKLGTVGEHSPTMQKWLWI